MSRDLQCKCVVTYMQLNGPGKGNAESGYKGLLWPYDSPESAVSACACSSPGDDTWLGQDPQSCILATVMVTALSLPFHGLVGTLGAFQALHYSQR